MGWRSISNQTERIFGGKETSTEFKIIRAFIAFTSIGFIKAGRSAVRGSFDSTHRLGVTGHVKRAKEIVLDQESSFSSTPDFFIHANIAIVDDSRDACKIFWAFRFGVGIVVQIIVSLAFCKAVATSSHWKVKVSSLRPAHSSSSH